MAQGMIRNMAHSYHSDCVYGRCCVSSEANVASSEARPRHVAAAKEELSTIRRTAVSVGQ